MPNDLNLMLVDKGIVEAANGVVSLLEAKKLVNHGEKACNHTD